VARTDPVTESQNRLCSRIVTQFLFVHKGVYAIVIGNLVSKLDGAGIEAGGIWRRETCAE